MSVFALALTLVLLVAVYRRLLRAVFGRGASRGTDFSLFGWCGRIVLNALLVLPRAVWFITHPMFPLFGSLFGRLFRKSDVFGSAQWMKRGEQRRLLSRKHSGLVLNGRDRLTEARSFQHLAVVAPTGAGKTTRVVVPNLLQLSSSCVVTDPSGEVFERTSGYLMSRGFEVKVLNLGNVRQSLCFNPLHRAITHSEIRKAVGILVDSAFPSDRGESSFWNDGAKSILGVLARCLQAEAREFRNLANLRYLLNCFGSDGRLIEDFVSRAADEATFREYKAFLAQDDRVMQGMLSTARTALDPISDPDLAMVTGSESLNFESLRSRKTIIYVIVPEHEIRYYSFVLSLLYSQLFSFCMSAPTEDQEPILFMLDEFAHARVPQFSTLITTLRKRRVSCTVILQDVEQLTAVYGRADAATILNGCTSRIFLPGLSLQSCRDLELVLGNSTVRVKETGLHAMGADPATYRDREMGRPLLTASEIRQLPDDQAILIHANRAPALLKMTPFYRDRELLKRSQLRAANLPANDRAPVPLVPLRHDAEPEGDGGSIALEV